MSQILSGQTVRALGSSKIYFQISILMLLIILADWLFFGSALGVTIPLFLGALALCASLARRYSNPVRSRGKLFLLLFLALLPGIETINPLTVSFGVLGVVIFALQINCDLRFSLGSWLKTLITFVLQMPLRLLLDIGLLRRSCKRSNQNPDQNTDGERRQSFVGRNIVRVGSIGTLAMPILLTFGFLILFAIGNPLIGQWLGDIDFFYPARQFSIERIVFWGGMATVLWPVLRVSRKVFRKASTDIQSGHTADMRDLRPSLFVRRFLGPTSVLQALIMFNALFAVQTYLDLIYLWGNNALPSGISYSEYAHRGTYILVITAFLAAAFILFVTSDARKQNISPLTRALLFLWTGQNIVLVISTMMRMRLYVEAYALTYLRIAVLIWMILVTIGLGLIVVRLLLDRPNVWLIKANLMSLVLVCYITGFANLPHIISDYNVTVAMQDKGKRLDIDYLGSLGIDALPAIGRAVEKYYSNLVNAPNAKWQHSVSGKPAAHWVSLLHHKFQQSRQNWRQWSFRQYRLARYLPGKESQILNFLRKHHGLFKIEPVPRFEKRNSSVNRRTFSYRSRRTNHVLVNRTTELLGPFEMRHSGSGPVLETRQGEAQAWYDKGYIKVETASSSWSIDIKEVVTAVEKAKNDKNNGKPIIHVIDRPQGKLKLIINALVVILENDVPKTLSLLMFWAVIESP